MTSRPLAPSEALADHQPRGGARIRARSGLLRTLLVLLLAAGASEAGAEQGWVKGELRLNLRSGGGNEYRILGTVGTGDSVKVLNRGTDWIQVQTQEGKVGWIPDGYLEAAPPATVRLATAEADVAKLQGELEKLRSETNALRESNAAMTANDDGQKKELETLTLQNLELRAATRYQEWLTGAALLGGGMLTGAWLHSRSANRRPSTRIRL
ncbi:MAG: TIGR04211 family SH3 domain-containing protein [Myxococcota bacterium]